MEIPSPTDSHGVEVSKLRKATVNSLHPCAYLASSPMVQLLHVPSPHRNEPPYTQSKGNLSATDAIVNSTVPSWLHTP